MEIVIALSVILILAAVAVPNVAEQLRLASVRQSADQLATVRDALYRPGAGSNAFFQQVGRNAGRLSELSEVIVKGDASYATGTDDSCGNSFTKGQVGNWVASGPFVNFPIDRTAGMQVPIGRAEDSLTRIPNSANPGVLRINFLDGVELPDAEALDDQVDGGNGDASGAVQWVLPDVDGQVTMYYFIPINNRC